MMKKISPVDKKISRITKNYWEKQINAVQHKREENKMSQRTFDFKVSKYDSK